MRHRWSLDLIFFNGGRAPTKAVVVRSQEAVRDRATAMLRDGRRVAVGEVELNEGDRGYDDWKILDDVWGTGDLGSPWEALHRPAREALIVPTTRLEVVSSKTRRAGGAVKRQSPPRPVHVTRVEGDHPDDPHTTFIVFHAAAGAKNGWRAPAARALLLVSWARTVFVARRIARNARRRGDHVAYLIDCNWRLWKRLTRHETDHVQHGPDVIGVIPAPGWDARLERQADIRTYIEPGLHPGLHARATFTRKPDRKEPRR